ncbi:hypothetical protein C9374_013874 [Naegleria lovaniensis]|uniref:Phospholipid-transporting ATPase n=1 Tax=Naegleria lovaniensis TaxID=51637 RepID=A0AA88H126_NAELO|nr:uncharacterized protein C9374_013874 [Naegleria lovaniensis]KAG2389314.1 hypothetical protein C9374_013874 [Naegleria lovaniensis]
MGFHQEANVTHRSSSNGHHVSDGDDAATIATLLSEDHDPRVVDHQQQQVYYSVVASEEIEYVPSSSPSVLHQQDESFDSNSEKEFDDSPRDNSLRIVYGNFESSNFENQKLIHEHYYDHILTPQLKQRQRDLANFLLNYNYHQNIILKIFSLICWIFYNIIITFIVHFCLKNIIFYIISLIYRCCNCERYNFGSLSTTSVVNDDISSSSSITTDHFNTFSLHRIFQNRRDFEKYWKQATTWLWNFLFADNNESLQTISEGVTSRTLFSRDRNCNYPRFCDNTISNTKYKWYNFFWKSISEQFSLRMNQYFLALACLQFWKVASPTNPITTWIPLIVVVTVGVAKEFIDDYFRYKKDTEINLNKVTIVRSGSFHVIPSYQVQVGDIVYLQEEEQIRADMILLKSSNILKKEKISRVESGDDVDPTTNDFLCDISGGIAWIETSALDGESHYKERKAIPEVQKLFSNNVNEYSNILNNFSCIVECSLPNADLDHFRGDLLVADRMGGFTRYPLSYHNLLLQGTTLKSTSHALALVVYTGNETKIGMNKKEAEMKWTKMDNFINHVVVGIFMVQLVIGLSFGIIGNYYNILQSQHSPFYLALDQYPILSVTNASTNTLLLFRILYNFIYPILPYLIIPLRFTMLCSLMIPQSLKITSDITKYIISMFFIAKDNGLSDKRGNMPSCSNTSVAEDLGQIQYIFTDKTGTITENLLTLSRVIVDGQVIRVPKHTNCSTASTTHFLWTHNTASNDSISMKFLRNLALCHTVYCENAENVYMPHYRSSSPEEDAFVKFAASQGVVLNYRDEERMVLKIYDNRDENSRDRSFVLEEYRILKVLYFTSDRRRMSIIVKQQEIDNIDSLTRYFIMCKGADDVLSERMDNKDPSLLQQTLSHIQTLASQEGLRVMLMAYRELSSDEVSTFMERISLADDSNEQSIFEEIETNFQLLGATAMEDKLQEGAAECIESLRDAGISIWMLTGDKMETAVQIAQTCHIIPSLPSDDLLLIYLRGSSVVTVRDALHQALTKLGNSSHLFACLIFEGKILNYILSDDDTNHHNQTAEIKSLENLILFLRLCEQVQACVCCRMTPKFKGKIVRMIKYPVTNIEDSNNNNRLQSLSSPICLAIGDGGNDVNMILEADVGVGISSSVKPTEMIAQLFQIKKFTPKMRIYKQCEPPILEFQDLVL